MRKRKVLFTSSFGGLSGGGQRSLLLLLKNLDKDAFEPFVTVPGKGELFEACAAHGIPARVLTFAPLRAFRCGRVRASAAALRSLLAEEQIEIMHTESPREALYAGWVARPAGVKTVFHARVSDSLFPWDRLLYRMSDRIIAVSEAAAQRFQKCGSEKVEVIYNGVDLQEFPVAKERDDGHVPVIGYFGKIEPRKGLEVLIRSFACLGVKAGMVIKGDAEAAYLKKLKRMSAGKDIAFKAYTSDIRDDMRRCDMLVLPSLKPEGFPRMLIESMAMAKCPLASDFPSHREALGDACAELLFPPGDYRCLARRLARLIADAEKRRSLGCALRGRVEERFDIRFTTRSVERAYRQLLGEAV